MKSAPLPKAKVEQIRQLAAQGERIIDIARTLGLDRGTVSRYLHADAVESSVRQSPAVALTQNEVSRLQWLASAFREVNCECGRRLRWLPPSAYVACVYCRNVWLVVPGLQPQQAGRFHA